MVAMLLCNVLVYLGAVQLKCYVMDWVLEATPSAGVLAWTLLYSTVQLGKGLQSWCVARVGAASGVMN